MQNQILLRISFTGEGGVGKTSLIERQALGEIVQDTKSSIGINFRVKHYKVGQKNVKAQFWDTVGGERFKSLQNPLFINRHAICVCFDINDRMTFVRLPEKITRVRNHTKCPIYLVACKSDLPSQVPLQEIEKLCFQEKLLYFQTSAQENIGVSQNFVKLINTALQFETKDSNQKKINLNQQMIKPQRSSCL